MHSSSRFTVDALLLVALVVANVTASAAAPTYENPLIPGNLADPAVVRHDGVYYLYATGEVDGDNGTRVFTSTDLVSWQPGPVVFRPGQPHVWAPDVWRDPESGRWYLYYTVSQTVGVAQADGPLGPFTMEQTFFERAIDAHLFRDQDGKLFLYYVQLPGFRISVQPLATPTEPAGEPRVLLQPEVEWETRSGRVTEGPWVIRHRDRYYLIYSGSGADTPDYGVGYATADSPLGPFTRAPHNPIIYRGDGVFGPGHGCAIQDGEGQWWHVYHQKRTERVEWDRFIALDPLWFDQYGNLSSRASRGVAHPAPVPAAAGPRQYDPVIWRSEPPADCPFEPSRDLTGIEFLGVHSDYRLADTWYPSWAADGNLYSPWTDGPCQADSSNSSGYDLVNDSRLGGDNARRRQATTGQAVLIGDDPRRLEIRSLGTVPADPYPYGGRYPCGSLVYGGVWYYGTYCLSPYGATRYGDIVYNWPWLGPLVGFRTSRDFGRTWTETPHTPSKPLFDESGMWGHPVKIGSPHFVDFGRELEHSPDGKAYLVATGADAADPQPRFANLSWITGDQVYLLRVTPSLETINDPRAYEFYAGRDAQGAPVWTRNLRESRPLLEWNNNMGCVTATYLAPLRRFLMCVTDGGNTCARMNTYLLEAGTLTGPWRLVTYLKHFGEQSYFVNVPSKFISPDGRTLWLCYSGNFAPDWNGEKIGVNPPGTRYGLVLQKIRLLGPGQP